MNHFQRINVVLFCSVLFFFLCHVLGLRKLAVSYKKWFLTCYVFPSFLYRIKLFILLLLLFGFLYLLVFVCVWVCCLWVASHKIQLYLKSFGLFFIFYFKPHSFYHHAHSRRGKEKSLIIKLIDFSAFFFFTFFCAIYLVTRDNFTRGILFLGFTFI